MSGDPTRILVVEDDRSVREAMVDFLSSNGFAIESVEHGGEADRCLAAERYDLIVLDVMLPGEDGLSLCRRLAGHGPPIIIVSAMGSTIDRIVGLELGAADYLAKPFEARELLARVRSILRQQGRRSEPQAGRSIHFGGLTYRPDDAALIGSDGLPLALTAGELQLLDIFLRRPGRLFGRETLLSLTDRAEDHGPYDRAIDLAVSRLRRKLRAASAGECLETVRGAGYRFVAQVVVR